MPVSPQRGEDLDGGSGCHRLAPVLPVRIYCGRAHLLCPSRRIPPAWRILFVITLTRLG